jgi:arylsulfatase
MDGVSLTPAFMGKDLDRNKPLYWEYSEGFAIRDGDMKAVRLRRAVDKEWELYDFSTDENETNDLAPTMPDKLKLMKQKWEQWYASVSVYETDR